MAVLKPRTRLIYFRVSEEEFQAFTMLCERQQSRSISDLARHAMQRLIADADVDHLPANPRVEKLMQLMTHVSSQLDQLMGATPVPARQLSDNSASEQTPVSEGKHESRQ